MSLNWGLLDVKGKTKKSQPFSHSSSIEGTSFHKYGRAAKARRALTTSENISGKVHQKKNDPFSPHHFANNEKLIRLLRNNDASVLDKVPSPFDEPQKKNDPFSPHHFANNEPSLNPSQPFSHSSSIEGTGFHKHGRAAKARSISGKVHQKKNDPFSPHHFANDEQSLNPSQQYSTEPMMEEVEASDMSHPMNMSRGGGKMMFLQRPGKQIRTQEDDSEEEDDVEEEEEVAYPPAQRGGKAFRRMGVKQLSLPLVAHESSEDEEDDDEDTDEIAPVVVPQPSNRASGKSLVNMQPLGGKQFRPPFPVQEEEEDDDDDDDDSDNEPEETRLVRLGSGKMLATAKSATQTKSTIANAQVGETEDMDVDSKEDTDKINPTDKYKTSAINQQIQSQLSSSNNKGKDTGNKKLASTVSNQPAKNSILKKRVVLDESYEDKDDYFDNDLSDDDEESKEEPDEEEDMDPEDLQQHHLIQDQADQKYLDSLPELEREEILAERYEKRKNELEMKKVLKEQRQHEQGLITSSQGKGTNSKKKSVSIKLSSSTKKTVLENSYSALKSTQKAKKVAARAEIRETRAAAKNAKRQKTRFTEEDEASDLDYRSEDNDDSDEDYDVKPWAMKKVTDVKSSDTIKDTSKAISSRNLSGGFEVDNKDEEENSRPAPRQVILADYAHYNMVTIPRRRLSRWCHEPFFEKAIQNYYVRVTGGRDPMTQKPVYNLCKIIGVVVKENLEYEFQAEPGEPIVKTNKYLKVMIGECERERPMNLVSNSPPLSDEINFFVSIMSKSHRLDDVLVSKKEALKMKELQEKLISNYQYTEQEIDQAVKTKKALTNTVAKSINTRSRTTTDQSRTQQLDNEHPRKTKRKQKTPSATTEQIEPAQKKQKTHHPHQQKEEEVIVIQDDEEDEVIISCEPLNQTLEEENRLLKEENAALKLEITLWEPRDQSLEEEHRLLVEEHRLLEEEVAALKLQIQNLQTCWTQNQAD